MIIQINATVCAALDHGQGGRPRSLAETSGRWCKKAREVAVTGGTTNPKSVVEVRFLQPMQYGGARGHHRCASSQGAR